MNQIDKWVKRTIFFFLYTLTWISANAVTPEAWKDLTYSYRVNAMPPTVGEVLFAFSKSMGVRTKVSIDVPIKQKALIDGSANNAVAFMDKLASLHGLSWFVHDGVLYVSNANQFKMERVPLGNISPAIAKQALQGLGIYEAKYGWGEIDDSPAFAIISGPADYIHLVKSAIASAESSKQEAEPSLMVFKLKYASAADTEYTFRDKSIQRPGVATILKKIMKNERDPLAGDDNRLESLTVGKKNTPLGMLGAASAPMPGLKQSRRFSPSIESFAPQNAVVVMDLPEKRGVYESLLASLDQPVHKVEIVATIIDAEVGTLREWSAGLTLGNGRNSFSSQPTLGALGEGSDANARTANPTVLLSLNDLALRIRALEANGKLEVLSKPSVLTLDNNGAVLDLSQSAIFKLIGERTVDLKSITVGTMLRVIPRVLGASADSAIRIEVEIEDGVIQSFGNAGDTPQTLRNSINTQAVVLQNQALVIGGYQRDQVENNKSQVPVLSSIPVLGGLFQANSKGQKKRERLYILTARTITD